MQHACAWPTTQSTAEARAQRRRPCWYRVAPVVPANPPRSLRSLETLPYGCRYWKEEEEEEEEKEARRDDDILVKAAPKLKMRVTWGREAEELLTSARAQM